MEDVVHSLKQAIINSSMAFILDVFPLVIALGAVAANSR